MSYAILSLCLAFIIAFGRQSAVFGRIPSALWFFTHFEAKRLIFAIASWLLGGVALYSHPEQTMVWLIVGTTCPLLLFSFLFDFKYVFPEVKQVKKQPGSALAIADETEVIGVKVQDTAVAYPLETLIARHIINDTVNTRSVVVSYCAICQSGLVFSSNLISIPLYFRVAGVWRRNMIMVDEQTQSLWQQATGECIYGKLKGHQLTLLAGENTTWELWKKAHPDSLYAAQCTEARKGYVSVKAMVKGLDFATAKITPPGFSSLVGLPERETVFGIHFNGISRAYPVSELKNVLAFTDYYGAVTVNITYYTKENHLTANDTRTGRPLIVEKHRWLGWKEFHPETQIWRKQTGNRRSKSRQTELSNGNLTTSPIHERKR